MVDVSLVEILNKEKLFSIFDKDKVFNEDTLKTLLSGSAISFLVSDVSRATTHEICRGDSYTQQSMRYVKMQEGSYIVPDGLSPAAEKEFRDTMDGLLKIYSKMTERKPGFENKKGRPKPDWFNFAPPEDARYLLALATSSNIFVTMPASGLADFFGSLSRGTESEQILEGLAPNLPHSLAKICEERIGAEGHKAVHEEFKQELSEGLSQTQVSVQPGSLVRAGIGAYTSTSASPASVLNLEDKKEKLTSLALKVKGYGHESILEHALLQFSTGMSLVTFHQFQRHRLQKIIREDFNSVPIGREVVIPPNIYHSQEARELSHKAEEMSSRLQQVLSEEKPELRRYALLNGTKIGVISTLNARTLYHIANERLCNNAQWEIRNFFEEIALEARKQEPELYSGLAPKCVLLEGCPEGLLSCGKYPEMKEKYK